MASTDTERWAILHKPTPQAKLRVFCFPFSGGAAQAFRPWALAMPDDIELVAIQLPGRWSRLAEAPYRRMTELVADAWVALQPLFNVPTVMYGHSLGGLIAFEISRRLVADGRPPRHLVVSGRRSPDAPLLQTVTQLGDDAFLEKLSELYGGIPEVVRTDAGLREIVLPPLRADMEVYETYRFVSGAPLDLPLTVWGGQEDRLVPPDELSSWRPHGRAEFSSKIFAGGHFFIQSAQALVIAELRALLIRVRDAEPPNQDRMLKIQGGLP